MKVWDDLVATALLGTDRMAAPVDLVDVVADGRAVEIDRGTPEGVLGRAAALTIYRRAGATALPVVPVPLEPAAPDPTPVCSAAASTRLALLLGGMHRVLLPEWLDRVAARQERVPEDRLPSLLDHGWHHRTDRPAIAAVAGTRGRWLAAQRPDWRWLLATADTDDTSAPAMDALRSQFELGSTDERRAAFATWRARQPDEARAALEQTWAGESNEQRVALLDLLVTAVDANDEPFLESLLDARTKPVRLRAAAALRHLPTSALVARLTERAAPLVELGSGIRPRLRVRLPDELTPADVRDGIMEKAPAKQGEHAWWFHQIVSAVPLGVWTARFGRSADDLLKMKVADEWADLLHGAWLSAAALQGDIEWMRAAIATLPAEQTEALFAALPASEVDLLIIPRLRERGLTPSVRNAIDQLDRPWSPELSRALIDLAVAAVRAGKARGLATPQSFAIGLHPTTLGHAIGQLRVAAERMAGDDPLSYTIHPLIDTLQFRHEMIQELP